MDGTKRVVTNDAKPKDAILWAEGETLFMPDRERDSNPCHSHGRMKVA